MLGVLIALLTLVPAPVLAQTAAAPPKYEALLAEADARLAAGEYAEAAGLYSKAATLQTGAARPVVGVARCEFELVRASADPAGLVRVRVLLREANSREKGYGGTSFLWGEVCLAERNHEAAVNAFRGALVKDFRSREARPLLAKSLLWWGADLVRKRGVSYDEVVDVLTEAERTLGALAKDGTYPEADRAEYETFRRKALVNLAAVHHRANDLPRAEKIVRGLIDLDPGNRDYRFSLGLLLAAADRADEAGKALEKSLALNEDPDWVEACRPLGHLKSLAGEVEAADELLSRYVGKRPGSFDGWLALGDHRLRHDRAGEAVAAYERCVELIPARAVSLRKLSRALRRAGRGEEAAKWLLLARVVESQ